MEQILELDKDLFLELNSYHVSWLDQLIMFLSGTGAWLPLYVFLLYLIIRKFRKETWMIVLAITLTIVLADQITSTIMKPFFQRLRPSHDPELGSLVHIVNHYRAFSKYGFASSHAANTFGIATLMWLLFKEYRPWIGLLFPWAIFVGYTRIYLGVHYPGDVLAGELIGFLAALVSYYLYLRLKKYMDQRKTLQPGD
jgi:undecaprenyl-diphosphatase